MPAAHDDLAEALVEWAEDVAGLGAGRPRIGTRIVTVAHTDGFGTSRRLIGVRRLDAIGGVRCR